MGNEGGRKVDLVSKNLAKWDDLFEDSRVAL